ncbi:hypothetical protein D0861_02928 [Hortaea werneckii]|uniref:Uncharacterized protein n=1 Tax=Hortaea werneckii TaxID=91943 RepID=A0A3M7FSB4_HORWE|nr:hypothetical protein D0861_02928 [Hortaea werneckii]
MEVERSRMDSSAGHGTRAEHDTLSKSKVAIKFLVDPKTGPQPTHLRTRTILRSLRYATIFIFWRLVRYAKYAAVGAIVAAVSGTAIGSVASGAAFLLAPTGILGGAGVGLLWAIGRFGWRRARARMDRRHHDESGDPRKDEQEDAHEGAVEQERAIRLPRAEPWIGLKFNPFVLSGSFRNHLLWRELHYIVSAYLCRLFVPV